MLNKGWLPLNEYSSKYRISLSTLRRRIRSAEAEFRFEDGKYWLMDRPLNKPAHSIGPTPIYGPNLEAAAGPSHEIQPPSTAHESVPANAEGLLHSAQDLLQELKNAYVKVLHEKEEQITQLKEEVIDLKTLVKILESENDRLKTNLSEASTIDGWLDKNIER